MTKISAPASQENYALTFVYQLEVRLTDANAAKVSSYLPMENPASKPLNMIGINI